jgi:hypothetical protein
MEEGQAMACTRIHYPFLALPRMGLAILLFAAPTSLLRRAVWLAE